MTHLFPDKPTVSITKDELVGKELNGGYRVLEPIGGGGMGSVYKAMHVELQRMFAIKLLKREYCDQKQYRDRFLQEARWASKIRHENVVDISNFGKLDDGTPFFVMEHLEGQDLHDLLQHEGRLPWARVCALMPQVMRALGAAHARGVIHRDVKPANCFLVCSADGREQIKVIDFGIAKVKELGAATSGQLTQTGVPLGTVKYMAPEQLRCEEIDARADVYALGIMMYELLVGRVPFDGQKVTQVIAQHLSAEPTPLTQAAPDAGIPLAVEQVVLKAVAKDPTERFQTMDEFDRALQVAIGGELPDVPRPRAQPVGTRAPVGEPSGPAWTTGMLTVGKMRGRAGLLWRSFATVVVASLVIGGSYVAVSKFLPDSPEPAAGPNREPPRLVAASDVVAGAPDPGAPNTPLGSEIDAVELPDAGGPSRDERPTENIGLKPDLLVTDGPPSGATASRSKKPERGNERKKSASGKGKAPAASATPQTLRPLSKDDVKRARAELAPALSSCQRAHGTRFPRKFRLNFRVTSEGGVIGCHAIDGPANNPLVQCVVKAAAKLQFPKGIAPEFETWSFEL